MGGWLLFTASTTFASSFKIYSSTRLYSKAFKDFKNAEKRLAYSISASRNGFAIAEIADKKPIILLALALAAQGVYANCKSQVDSFIKMYLKSNNNLSTERLSDFISLVIAANCCIRSRYCTLDIGCLSLSPKEMPFIQTNCICVP